MRSGIPVETATRVYRRYLKLEPTHVEEYIAYLKKQVGMQCASLLIDVSQLCSDEEVREQHQKQQKDASGTGPQPKLTSK
jgi:hypothetical protein